jgi:5-methylthioadenosine/S-adenosylhomocysteine deaminase
MNIRFFNANVLTMEDGKDIFRGEIFVSGDRILFVGTDEEAGRFFEDHPDKVIKWDKEIDCGGNLLMPGFNLRYKGLAVFQPFLIHN